MKAGQTQNRQAATGVAQKRKECKQSRLGRRVGTHKWVGGWGALCRERQEGERYRYSSRLTRGSCCIQGTQCWYSKRMRGIELCPQSGRLAS